MDQGRSAWVKRLRGAAESTLGVRAVIPGPGVFKDERGVRLETDEGLLAALRSQVWGAPSGSGGDVRLWGGGSIDAVVLPEMGEDGGRALLGDWMNQPADRLPVSMEVWGERELCGLHAMWSRARVAGVEDRARWLRRGRSACRWLLENLQPDNATNHPWSVHVWVLVADDGPWGRGLGPEARVYAETLLHNAQVGGGGTGRVGKRAAWILTHAALELESW